MTSTTKWKARTDLTMLTPDAESCAIERWETDGGNVGPTPETQAIVGASRRVAEVRDEPVIRTNIS